jgi:hypothetical protein
MASSLELHGSQLSHLGLRQHGQNPAQGSFLGFLCRTYSV